MLSYFPQENGHQRGHWNEIEFDPGVSQDGELGPQVFDEVDPEGVESAVDVYESLSLLGEVMVQLCHLQVHLGAQQIATRVLVVGQSSENVLPEPAGRLQSPAQGIVMVTQ